MKIRLSQAGFWLFTLSVFFTFAYGQAGWKEYSFPDDGFAISAPSEPIFEKDTTQTPIGPLESHTYQVPLGAGGGFMVSAAEFKQGEAVPVRELLQAAKNGAAANSKSTASKERDVSLEGNLGLEFELGNEVFHSRVRVFYVHGKLLTVMAAAPAATAIPPEADRLFNSLRLIRKAA
jgi:hypothetical protein